MPRYVIVMMQGTKENSWNYERQLVISCEQKANIIRNNQDKYEIRWQGHLQVLSFALWSQQIETKPMGKPMGF